MQAGARYEMSGAAYPPILSREPELLRPKPSQERVVTNTSRNSQKIKNKEERASMSTMASSFESEGSFSSKRNSLEFTRQSQEMKVTDSRQEFVETLKGKAAFKEFSTQFRIKCKISSEEGEKYALETIESIPDSTRWRIFIELAELAKKNNNSGKVHMHCLIYTLIFNLINAIICFLFVGKRVLYSSLQL
jgi:hypothetical protein